MYGEGLDPFPDVQKDVVVLGASLEGCAFRSIDAFGHTYRLAPVGKGVEVPALGYPLIDSSPDEHGIGMALSTVPWQDVSLAVIAAPRDARAPGRPPPQRCGD